MAVWVARREGLPLPVPVTVRVSGDAGSCTDTVPLTVSEYEEVRSESRWFAVLPDHVTEEIEHVVRAHPHYMVVEKDTADAAQIADETDPRG